MNKDQMHVEGGWAGRAELWTDDVSQTVPVSQTFK